jgi:MbtH protein
MSNGVGEQVVAAASTAIGRWFSAADRPGPDPGRLLACGRFAPGKDARRRKQETDMSDPFDDETARFVVLVNDEGQHTLWPVFADVPPGWTVVYGEGARQSCLAYIEESWTDMRPKSLADAMAADDGPGGLPN